MAAPRNLFAYTAPEAFFPEFISVNEVDGAVEFHVRGAPTSSRVGTTSSIKQTKEQALQIALAILKALAPDAIRINAEDLHAETFAEMQRQHGVLEPVPVLSNSRPECSWRVCPDQVACAAGCQQRAPRKPKTFP